MLYELNNANLKLQVAKHIEEFRQLLIELRALSHVSPNSAIRKAVTKTYSHLLKFLKKAVGYYKESKISMPGF